MPKIIQIVTTPGREDWGLIALCDDGSVWLEVSNGNWRKADLPPELTPASEVSSSAGLGVSEFVPKEQEPATPSYPKALGPEWRWLKGEEVFQAGDKVNANVSSDGWIDAPAIFAGGSVFDWINRCPGYVAARRIEPPKPTAEDYLKGHEASGIKVGDYVRVTRIPRSWEQGWGDIWAPGMTPHEHRQVASDGNRLGFQLDDGWYYPYFVLEKVPERKPEVALYRHNDKSYRLCDERDIGKLVRVSDTSFEVAIIHKASKLVSYNPKSDIPYRSVVPWKLAFIEVEPESAKETK